MAGLPVAGAAVPLDLSEALSIPADNRTGTIADVEHVIILMQENRSFDHYFGTMRGVRGFADPYPMRLPSGQTVWHQPNGPDKVLLPFRPDVPDVDQSYLPDPPHGWNDGKSLTGSWAAAGEYDVDVHGPNGFHRSFRGEAQAPAVAVTTDYNPHAEKITLVVANLDRREVKLTVRDGYTGRRSTLSLRGGQSTARSWSVAQTHGWYNLVVTNGPLRHQYAGHVENGRDSISDPAMGGLV